MRSNFLPLAVTVCLLFGCGLPSARKMNRVSIGMDRTSVLKVLGRPNSVSATGGIEYLLYALDDRTGDHMHFVRIESGRVTSFGRVGDFGTTMPDRKRIEMEIQRK